MHAFEVLHSTLLFNFPFYRSLPFCFISLTPTYYFLHRLEADYVPVIDPDDGNLVSILGYLDVVHLLDQGVYVRYSYCYCY